jgi:hypothetical protein
MVGYFFDLSITPDVENRVIDTWVFSNKIYQLDLGYILVLKEPEYRDVTNSIGAPLFDSQGYISNVELIQQKGISTQKDENVVMLMRYGTFSKITLSTSLLFDPSVWVELEDYTAVKLETLGVIAPAVVKVIAPNSDIRKILNSDAVENNKRLILDEALSNLDKNIQEESVNKADREIKTISFFSKLHKFFMNNNIGRGSEQVVEPECGAETEKKQPRTDIIDKPFLNVKNIPSQENYIKDLIKEYRKGDIDSAIKKSIPIANFQDMLTIKEPFLGKIESGLSSDKIQPYKSTYTSRISLEKQLLDQLFDVYKIAFNKLDQEGRYQKAAFILAELLRDIDRAVAYLEKHGQLELAAQLAEGQRLPRERVIRQWVLAGNIKRALHITVISGCYEETITSLEKNHQKAAKKLRWHCAQLHYHSGNLSKAIDLAWPIVDKRESVILWIKELIQIGGNASARHLHRLVLHDQENIEQYLLKIEYLLNHSRYDTTFLFYDQVIRSGKHSVNARIAALCVRHYLINVAKGRLVFQEKRWDRLCDIAGDLTLRADIRNLQLKGFISENHLTKVSSPKQYFFEASHGRSVLDIVVLHNGQILVAYGESGVELWHANGKLSGRIAVPCHEMVLSDERFTALFVAKRSGYQVIHKYDLRSKRAQYWLDLKVNTWAKSFDGNGWFVGQGVSLQLIDVSAKKHIILWCVNDLPGMVKGILRTKQYLTAYLEQNNHFQLWTYRISDLYLQDSAPYQHRVLKESTIVAYSAEAFIVSCNASMPEQLGIIFSDQEPFWYTPDISGKIVRIKLTDQYLLVLSKDIDRVSLYAFSINKNVIEDYVLSMGFQDADDLKFRVINKLLVMSNIMGRIVVVEMAYGGIIADFVV